MCNSHLSLYLDESMSLLEIFLLQIVQSLLIHQSFKWVDCLINDLLSLEVSFNRHELTLNKVTYETGISLGQKLFHCTDFSEK